MVCGLETRKVTRRILNGVLKKSSIIGHIANAIEKRDMGKMAHIASNTPRDIQKNYQKMNDLNKFWALEIVTCDLCGQRVIKYLGCAEYDIQSNRHTQLCLECALSNSE